MSSIKKGSLEEVNVQQAGKNELKNVLKRNSLDTLLKAAFYAKKRGKKRVTNEELEEALK